MSRSAVLAVLRLARRDLLAHRARTALAVLVVAVASSLAATTVSAIARTLAPGSSVAQSGAQSAAATGTVDAHVVDFLLIVAFIALVLMVMLIVPVFLTGFRRQMRQLGQLAAAGAAPAHLMGAVLVPAASIGVVGGAIGAVIGYVAGSALTPAPGAPSSAQLLVPALACVAVVLGVVALCLACAAYPARQAAHIAVIDAVRGRTSTTGSSSRRPWLWVAGLVAGAAGVVLLRSSARTGAVPGLLVGLLLACVALCCLVAVLAASAARIRVARSFSATFALRDASRHLLRVVPGTGAGAAILATLVAAVVFTGSTAANEVRSHIPVAPLGAALVVGASVEEASEAVATVAGVAQAVPVRVVDGTQGVAALSPGQAPVVLDRSPTALTDGRALVADPDVLDLFGLQGAARADLDRGAVVVREDLASSISDGSLTLQNGGGQVHLDAAASLPANAPAGMIVPATLLDELGAQVEQSAVVVVAARALDEADVQAISDALASGFVSVEAGSPVGGSAPTQFLLIGLGAALVFAVILLLAALARDESRADVATLEAVGAGPGFARRVAFTQSFLQALLAVLVGAPTGLALGSVLLELREISVPATGAATQVPWVPLGVAVAVLPALVAFAVAALAPRPTAMARRQD